jgi:hypothetical protein
LWVRKDNDCRGIRKASARRLAHWLSAIDNWSS